MHLNVNIDLDSKLELTCVKKIDRIFFLILKRMFENLKVQLFAIRKLS